MEPQGQEYYNSLNLSHEELPRERKRAMKGTERILDFMRRHKGEGFTPHQLDEIFNGRILLGSIRRVLTTLTDRGLLEKSRVKVMERYNSKNFMWRYNL